jgi:hypothetical protein
MGHRVLTDAKIQFDKARTPAVPLSDRIYRIVLMLRRWRSERRRARKLANLSKVHSVVFDAMGRSRTRHAQRPLPPGKPMLQYTRPPTSCGRTMRICRP